MTKGFSNFDRFVTTLTFGGLSKNLVKPWA